MKKWTEHQPRAQTITQSSDFSQEYSQYKSVLNGGIDRTANPAGFFTAANCTDYTFQRVYTFLIEEISNNIDSTNTPSSDNGFECLTFTSYQGGWVQVFSQSLAGIKEGFVQLEVGATTYLNPYQTSAGSIYDVQPKNMFLRLDWNGETICTAGPISQTMKTIRLCAGTFTASGTGTLSMYMRASTKKGSEFTNAPMYFIYNINGLVIGRWR